MWESYKNDLLTFIQPQCHIFQNSIPMLLLAMLRALPFKKGTFVLKGQFFSTLKVGGHMRPVPSLPTPKYTILMFGSSLQLVGKANRECQPGILMFSATLAKCPRRDKWTETITTMGQTIARRWHQAQKLLQRKLVLSVNRLEKLHDWKNSLLYSALRHTSDRPISLETDCFHHQIQKKLFRQSTWNV